MRLLADDPMIELLVVATGIHMSPRFGNTVEAIERYGFAITARVPILEDEEQRPGDGTPCGSRHHRLGRGLRPPEARRGGGAGRPHRDPSRRPGRHAAAHSARPHSTAASPPRARWTTIVQAGRGPGPHPHGGYAGPGRHPHPCFKDRAALEAELSFDLSSARCCWSLIIR